MVGCGRIGALAEDDPVGPKPASHVGAWRAHPRVLLEAVCDLDIARAQAVAGAFTYADLAELLRIHRLNLDIVSVATPPETHGPVVWAVCQAARPRAIVCEKPLAMSSLEADGIVKMCREAGILLFVNHTRRFDWRLRQEVERLGQRVGTPRTAVARYSGGLQEGGTHMLDLLRMFLGEGKVLAASRGDAFLDFGGCRAALQGHDITDHVIFDLSITGDRGALHVERFGLDVRWERVDGRYPLASGYRALELAGACRDPAPRSLFAGMAEHVVNVLEGKEPPVSTGEDGVAALALVEAIQATQG